MLKLNAEEEARKTFVFRKKSGSRSKYVDSTEKAVKKVKLSTEAREK